VAGSGISDGLFLFVKRTLKAGIVQPLLPVYLTKLFLALGKWCWGDLHPLRNFCPRNGLVNERLDTFDVPGFGRIHEGNGSTCSKCSARAADAMHVILVMSGNREVDHMADLIDIQSTSAYIGAYQDA